MTESEKIGQKTDLPSYLFHQGTNFYSYDYLGCHLTETSGGFECVFRTWAPNATAVALVGDLFGWDSGIPMQRVTEGGVWETAVPVPEHAKGTFYKYKIENHGVAYYKADPYAFSSQTNGETASVITGRTSFAWGDDAWKCYRRSIFNGKRGHFYPAPLNIYEMHLGSWKTRDGCATTDGKHYLNYREIADELAPYVKKMGYTHVELLPIMEYPYDGSWGYQVCGYYAPTSRYGSPDDFRYFVDKLHRSGIGVILDWVPAHFPKDRHGLYEYDGQPLYEYQGKDRMEHKVWGTRFFDVGRNEVQSFLISNALYWLREFHADGLRIDAVASMLYLDYDREPGEWNPNPDGSNRNEEAIAFFRKLNTAVFGEFPDVLMIAEESTDWPMITKPVFDGGLGFNYKWNMGWANDLFSYVETDPLFRQYQHEKLTFPLMYAFRENYVLPVSHDEVVHGKKSLIGKMAGEYDEKFSAMRTFLTYMMTLPGKKLLFMGTEFAQFREWDYENPLEWFMLDYPRHAEMQRYVAELNHLYLSRKELWEIDDGWDGFTWIETEQREWNTVSYRRRSVDGSELIVLLNFSPVKRENYELRVPKSGDYHVILNSDEYRFGGTNVENEATIPAQKYRASDGANGYRIYLTVPPSGALILERRSGRKHKNDM